MHQIYQLATDAETGNIYVLMTDGEVRVYDAAAPMVGGKGSGVGQPMWTCQLITHDPSPRGLGTEGRQEYRRWRQMVGLDPPTDGKGKQCEGATVVAREWGCIELGEDIMLSCITPVLSERAPII